MEEQVNPQSEVVTSQGGILRFLIVVAAATIITAGLKGAASIVGPILFGLVTGVLFSPLYGWMRRRGTPTWLAIILLLAIVIGILVGLALLFGNALARFASQLGYYATGLSAEIDRIQQKLDEWGLGDIDLQTIMNSDVLSSIARTIINGIISFISSLYLVIPITLLFVFEAPAIVRRLRASVGEDNPRVERLSAIGSGVIRQVGLRAIINLVTGAGFTLILLLLGVDYAVMWGVLAFFLSFIPYIGLVIATIPPVILALAESGLGTALLVIVGSVVVNVIAENVLEPMLMSKGLNLSPTVVFISFVVWTWVLDAPGVFLAMPITLMLAVMLATFPETLWLANLMVVRTKPKETVVATQETVQPTVDG
jgi:predicted PurR-regulated permease PerM